MPPKTKVEPFEITSGQIHGRLIHIEDRLAGVEAILAHANRAEIETLITTAIGGSDLRKTILRECATPKTIKELQAKLGLKSAPSLHYHLTPLKDNGLIRHASTDSPVTYECGPMVMRLSAAARDKLLK